MDNAGSTVVPDDNNNKSAGEAFELPEKLNTFIQYCPRNRVELEEWINLAPYWYRKVRRYIVDSFSLGLSPENLAQRVEKLKSSKKLMNARVVNLRDKLKNWDCWVEYLQCFYYPASDIELNLKQYLALRNADFDYTEDEPPNSSGSGFSDVHMETILQLKNKSARSKGATH